MCTSTVYVLVWKLDERSSNILEFLYRQPLCDPLQFRVSFTLEQLWAWTRHEEKQTETNHLHSRATRPPWARIPASAICRRTGEKIPGYWIRPQRNTSEGGYQCVPFVPIFLIFCICPMHIPYPMCIPCPICLYPISHVYQLFLFSESVRCVPIISFSACVPFIPIVLFTSCVQCVPIVFILCKYPMCLNFLFSACVPNLQWLYTLKYQTYQY